MSLQDRPCEICGSEVTRGVDDIVREIECPRCGIYKHEAIFMLPDAPPPVWLRLDGPGRARLSGWIREQNASGVAPTITVETSRRVRAMPLPALRRRAELLLGVLVRRNPDLYNVIEYGAAWRDPELQAVSYSVDEIETRNVIRILEADNLIADIERRTFQLTPKGLLRAEELRATSSASATGFVAMWFDKSLDDAWTNGFDPGIRAAGYRPIRIDNQDYVGGISDEIMSRIRYSKFIVVDYTNQRNGVYFEAGFAFGLGLPVIPTCRSDDVDNLHFDIKHLNTLLWKTPPELADGLARRIRAVVGLGPDLS